MRVRLEDKLGALATALGSAGVPHAFSGAIALAYALTGQRAATVLEVNVFVPHTSARTVLTALPPGVSWTERDQRTIARDHQVRLWWDRTPVDVFFSASRFHDDVARRVRTVPFAARTIRVLDPVDLATFAVLCDREEDWVDLRLMWESETLDVPLVARQLDELLGDDDRVRRLHEVPAGGPLPHPDRSPDVLRPRRTSASA